MNRFADIQNVVNLSKTVENNLAGYVRPLEPLFCWEELMMLLVEELKNGPFGLKLREAFLNFA